MINSATVAILVCLEFVTPQGFDENCNAMVNRAIHVMEKFDLQEKAAQDQQERRASVVAQIVVENQCANQEKADECKKAGMNLAHMIWKAIIDGAHELRLSHTA
jgi:hypothetical protein